MAIGIAYNRFVRHRRGLQQIPQYAFWSSAIEFVQDMFYIIAAKVRGSGGRQDGYRNFSYMRDDYDDADNDGLIRDDDFDDV